MPGVNTILQDQFLDRFFSTQFASKFYLTGGTALSRFYLNHRESVDLDLFTNDKLVDFASLNLVIGQIARELNLKIISQITTNSYLQFIFEDQNNENLKIDLVKDVGIQLGQTEKRGKVVIDSLENIAVNKVLAVFGRTDAKDFVDLYFLLERKNFVLEDLIEKAKKKDVGLSEFYLAGAIANFKNVSIWPKMLVELNKNDLKKFYNKISTDIFKKIKPATLIDKNKF